MNSATAAKTKRDEILDVASKLFYEQGYHQAGIQQIIREADTAKGTFYTHFKSKEALGVAWLQGRHTTWNGWFENALAAAATPKDKILAAFDFLCAWMQDCQFRGCAFLNTLGETPDPASPLRQEIANHKRELLERFQGLVADHQPEATPEQTRQTGKVIYLLFEGALIEMQNFCDIWPGQAAKKDVALMLQ